MNEKKRSNQVPGYALMGVGVIALGIGAWTKLGRMSGGEIVLAMGVTALVVGGVFMWAKMRNREAAASQSPIGLELPGWTLHQGWSDAGLGDALARAGVQASGLRASGGTHLTLAWSGTGVALWRAGRNQNELLTLPWHDVAAVTVGSGQAASTPRPAVVIRSSSGVELTVVPTAKPGGGLLPASRATVEQLVADLEAVRGGAAERSSSSDVTTGDR